MKWIQTESNSHPPVINHSIITDASLSPMPTDYAAIKRENERKYGTDIGRIGKVLLSDRYDDRTHFIFELLQNAEDALARRNEQGIRGVVEFSLAKDCLRMSHFGDPFTEADVNGICGIGEGTKAKDLTAIGHFGIGFKAVYAFTNAPRIHSGEEHFAIDSYVWPRAIEPVQGKRGQTIFIFPFSANDHTVFAEIAKGFPKLGVRTVLFLRQIDEIVWTVEGGNTGRYRRTACEPMPGSARRVTLIGQVRGKKKVVEHWLVFSQDLKVQQGQPAGSVEVAFEMEATKAKTYKVRRLPESPLVVYFPTIVSTNLGFLVQGPYRTTPSRDNVPRNNAWNQNLVNATAELLVSALRQMRGLGLLDAHVLEALPLDHEKFEEDTLFGPLFDKILESLQVEELLPCYSRGHASAAGSLIARGHELRQLLQPAQLLDLFGDGATLKWLSKEITQDRTPELHQYLRHDLKIREIEPWNVLGQLSQGFLEKQSDKWIIRFYEFLRGQPSLLQQDWVRQKPLIRLEDGSHVSLQSNGTPRAYLPGRRATGFPTAKRSICRHPGARKCLVEFGLTDPDPVDDVLHNVLPRYSGRADSFPRTYDDDVRQIVEAFHTDSMSRRAELVERLSEACWIPCRNAGTNDFLLDVAGPDTYLPTKKLKSLFQGNPSIWFIARSKKCLHGPRALAVLEACGATGFIQRTETKCGLSAVELQEIRRQAGLEQCSRQELTDYVIMGLDDLLERIVDRATDWQHRSLLLWDCLHDALQIHGEGFFQVEYKWYFSQVSRSKRLPTEFVRLLQNSAWLPGSDGQPKMPSQLGLADLSAEFRRNAKPFIVKHFGFKPDEVKQLADKTGIGEEYLEVILDAIREQGVSAEEVRKRLGLKKRTGHRKDTERDTDSRDVDQTIDDLLGGDRDEPTPPIPDPSGPERSGTGTGSGSSGKRSGVSTGGSESDTGGNRHRGTGRKSKGQTGGGRSNANGKSGRPFISYVGAHPDDEEPDPDGLDQVARMALEEKAILFILSREPQLRRTPTHNPGFDLFEADSDGEIVRWVEVKAMTHDLHYRPVGLSRTQVECARKHGLGYLLYVVEHADDGDAARIVRIQDPIGKARTFTFDHGWLGVTEQDESDTVEGDTPASIDS